MTAPQQRAVFLGVLTTVLGTLLLGGFRTAYEAKADKAEYDLHVQRAERDIYETREMVLELLCETKPESRRCR